MGVLTCMHCVILVSSLNHVNVQNHVYPVSYMISSIKMSKDTLVIYLILHLPFPMSNDRCIIDVLSESLLLNKRPEEAGTVSRQWRSMLSLYFLQSRNGKKIKM